MYESSYILSLKMIIFGVYTLAIQYILMDSMTGMQAQELFHFFCHSNDEQDVPSLPPTPTYHQVHLILFLPSMYPSWS